MTPSTANNDVYRDQLTRWARALAAARDEAVQNVLAPGSTPEQVRMFVEDNVGKRLEKLQKQLEFTAAAFDAFDELLRSYTSAFPLTAYATAESDGERFLDWLERTGRLTPEQRDHVACQRARQIASATSAFRSCGAAPTGWRRNSAPTRTCACI
jgi:hypothetical protein